MRDEAVAVLPTSLILADSTIGTSLHLPLTASFLPFRNGAARVTADTIDMPRAVVASSDSPDALQLATLAAAEAPAADPASRAIAGWVRGYLMRPHPDLGRTGHVCPFTAQAARLSLVRIGTSQLSSVDGAAILATMREAMRAFDTMPCTKAARIFRTVIVAFPRCADAEGIAALHNVQNAMRHHSIVRARMIGLFEPASEATGLINPAFRPLRAPVPALAIRMLVEQDAPFVLRNPLLAPVYLVKFPIAGTRRLFAAALRRKPT